MRLCLRAVKPSPQLLSRPETRYRRSMSSTDANAIHPTARQFLDSVLRLEPRVAAFDCDGTLWSGDVGERFFDWELRESDVFGDGPDREKFNRTWRDRYAAYKRNEVAETTMCGEMVAMHAGISERKLMDASNRFFDE